MDKPILTYSEIRSWKQCRLQHDYRYRQQLSAKGHEAHYSRRGNFVHGYIERMYREVGKETIDDLIALLTSDWNEATRQYMAYGADEDELKKEFAVIKGMILGYHQYFFQTEQWDGVVAEREVMLDVPDGGLFACKIDAIVKEKEKYWIHDIKTVASFSDTDKRLLMIDEQFSYYCVVAGERFSRQFSGGIRTAIKTPGIKQTQKETVDQYCARVVQTISPVRNSTCNASMLIVPRTNSKNSVSILSRCIQRLPTTSLCSVLRRCNAVCVTTWTFARNKAKKHNKRCSHRPIL